MVACFGHGLAWWRVLAELGARCRHQSFFHFWHSQAWTVHILRTQVSVSLLGLPGLSDRRAELAADSSAGFLWWVSAAKSAGALGRASLLPPSSQGSHTTGAQSGPVRFVCPADLPRGPRAHWLCSLRWQPCPRPLGTGSPTCRETPGPPTELRSQRPHGMLGDGPRHRPRCWSSAPQISTRSACTCDSDLSPLSQRFQLTRQHAGGLLPLSQG